MGGSWGTFSSLDLRQPIHKRTVAEQTISQVCLVQTLLHTVEITQHTRGQDDKGGKGEHKHCHPVTGRMHSGQPPLSHTAAQ